MVDWTYNHFRVLMRLLAPHALLYTEMQHTAMVINNPQRALAFHPMESPLTLQLGGNEPKTLAACAIIAERAGFAEVNLNLGCPSDRVKAGQFGACLMAHSPLVMDCIAAMKDAVKIPVSAKIRIGIDQQDSYDFFADFAYGLVTAGCDKLIVHARKAWLNGLSPKQNRTIPPLHYDYVYRLKQSLPGIPIVINGNICTFEDVTTHLSRVNGVMIGRLAYEQPYRIAQLHHALYPEYALPTRRDILCAYLSYLQTSGYLHSPTVSRSLILKPIYQLAHGLPEAKRWKAYLTQKRQQHHLILQPGVALGGG